MMADLARQALRVLVAALLAVTPLSAGINRWTPVGPPGGDPANLAAATPISSWEKQGRPPPSEYQVAPES